MFNTRLTAEQSRRRRGRVRAPHVQHGERNRGAQRTGTIVKCALQQLGSIRDRESTFAGRPGWVHMDPWVARDSSAPASPPSDVV